MRTNARRFHKARIWVGASIFSTLLLFTQGSTWGNVVDDGSTVHLAGVPYIHQSYDTDDNFGAGDFACSVTAALMAIQYFNVLPPNPITCSRGGTHVSQYGYYISSVYTYNGHTFNTPSGYDWGWQAVGYPGGFGYMLQDSPGSDQLRATRLKEYIALHGLASLYEEETSGATEDLFQKICGEINLNHLVMVFTTFTASNHYALCIGYVKGQHTLIFNDPYGNKNQADWPNWNGAGVRYDWPGYNHGNVNLLSVPRVIYAGTLPCNYNLNAASANHPSGYGEGNVGVNCPNGCTWSATTRASWIHTTSSGMGGGTVQYTLDRNRTSAARQGTIAVEGQSFTVNQIASTGLPGAANLVSPDQGSSWGKLDTPQFSWTDGDPPGDWYYVYMSRNGSPYMDFWVQASSTSAQTSWTPTNGFATGNYSWWVQSWNGTGFGAWSQTGNFTVTGIPSQITPIGPSGTESSPTVNYSWNVADRHTAWYELYVMKDGALFSDSWHQIANGDLIYTANDGLGQVALNKGNHSSGSYQWWVRGWSSDGLGPWSSTMSFTVALPSVVLISPGAGEAVSDLMPVFSWQDNSGAPWYSLWIYRNGIAYFSTWVQTTSWQPTNAMPSGNYTWWVAPWNTGGLGSWVSSSFTISSRVPGQLTPIAPSGSVSAQNPMPYSWASDPNASWYELAIVKDGSLWFDQWLPLSSSTSTVAGQYETQVNRAHGTGSYSWWVRGWGSDGIGPWSQATAFSIP